MLRSSDGPLYITNFICLHKKLSDTHKGQERDNEVFCASIQPGLVLGKQEPV
jgi:nitrite reductase/ring-hydroxylating ferredoxin subunit